MIWVGVAGEEGHSDVFVGEGLDAARLRSKEFTAVERTLQSAIFALLDLRRPRRNKSHECLKHRLWGQVAE